MKIVLVTVSSQNLSNTLNLLHCIFYCKTRLDTAASVMGLANCSIYFDPTHLADGKVRACVWLPGSIESIAAHGGDRVILGVLAPLS